MTNEELYITTMFFAKQMLDKGIITQKEFCAFNTKMKNKYSPSLGGLFVDFIAEKR